MQIHEVKVLGLIGDLIQNRIEEVKKELDHDLGEAHPKGLVIALAQVGRLDAGGVALLAGLIRQVKDRGGKACLAEAAPRLAEGLKLAGLSRLAPLLKDREEARDYLCRQS